MLQNQYLINPDLVTNVNTGSKTLTYDGITIEPEELTEHLITIEDQTTGATKSDDYRYIFYQNKKVYQDHDDGEIYYTMMTVLQKSFGMITI